MAAPNLKEIEWAISELEAEETSKTGYILLAALYTCRNQMLGLNATQSPVAAYSEAESPVFERLGSYGNSDFLRAIEGKDPGAVWSVINDHMDTLHILNPKAYEGVMRKLGGI